MNNTKVNVIGSGVIGLTTALLLQQKGYNVTIIASDFPGDKNIQYTSPCAGARWKTLAPNSDLRLQRHDAVSFRFFWELAKSNAAEAGIMIVSAFDYYQEKPTKDQLDPWWKNLVHTFQFIGESELPKDTSFGYYYTTMVINPVVYLPWLLKKFLNMGGRCQKKNIQSISEVVDDVDIVVNCTGIRAKELAQDQTLIASQEHNLMVVKAPQIRQTMSIETKSSYTYIIPRSDGTVVLGTTNKEDNTGSSETGDKTTASFDILQRAIECCPELGVKGSDSLQVLETTVGLRPTRKGGPRIQNEFHISPTGKKTLITHNYGHGGSGYQSSWGSCQEAIKLVRQGHALIKHERLQFKKLLSRL